MKRKITFLIAALMLLTMINLPKEIIGQVAPLDQVLWSENFGGYSATDVPSGSVSSSHTGTTVWNSASVSYTCGVSGTQVYNENNAGGTKPELLIKQNNGTFTVTGIPTGGASVLTITYKFKNGTMSITSSTQNVSISGSASGSTVTTNGASTIDLTFKNTHTSKNMRFDDVQITVTKAKLPSPTNFAVTPGNAEATITWNAVANMSSYTLSYTTDSEWGSQDDITGLATNSTTIEGLENGTTYYVKVKAVGNGTTYTDSNYTDALSFTPSSATYYTVTINPSITGGTVTASPTSAIEEATITLTPTPDDCYSFTSWDVRDGSSNVVPVNGSNQFTMPDSNVTVNAIFTQNHYTVSYSVNGNIEDDLEEDITCGSNASLWDADKLANEGITIPSGYSLAGWSTDANNIDILESFSPTETATLYAVFVKTGTVISYKRVTSDLGSDWAGDYLIAYSNTIFADGRVGGTGDNGIGKQNVKVDLSESISNNSIPVATGDTYNVTLEEISSGSNTYLLKTKDGNYNYQTSYDNGLAISKVKNTAANYPISVIYTSSNDIKFKISISANNYVAFRYNTNGYFRYYKDAGQSSVYLYKKIVPSYYTLIKEYNGNNTIATVTPTDLITVPNHAVLTITETCTGTVENLIVEDGGQLLVSNTGVKATFKKTMSTSSKASYWNTISSPIKDMAIADVTYLVTGEGLQYNLYRYNEYNSTAGTGLWEAYNPSNHADFTTLEKCRGYLYRNNGKDIEFPGEVNVGNTSVTVTNHSASGSLRGFNLIGNPFGHDIYKGTGAAIADAKLNDGFYYLTNEGSWHAGYYNTPIPPKTGILVQLNNSYISESITITDTKDEATAERYANDNIEFIVSNNEYEDVAYAMFHNGNGLNKINHRNPDVPMIYIPQDGENFAIAMMSDNTKVFGLNFKAFTIGKYVLSYKAEGNFDYLHIIDRLTGNDVDMLLEGEYSFIATPNDNDNRFIVKLAYKPDYSDADNDNFAYQSGNEVLVSGDGELQIYDVTGRMIMSNSINGVEAVNIPAQGVYVFRLVGNEVKTQKIVVR